MLEATPMDNFDIERSKLAIFGRWLTEQALQRQMHLHSVCSDIKHPADAIRLQYGKMEAFKYILDKFTELYQGDITQFMKSYLDLSEEEKVELADKDDGNEP